jgi:hypothetical protein
MGTLAFDFDFQDPARLQEKVTARPLPPRSCARHHNQ